MSELLLLWKRYWVSGCLGSKHKMQGKMGKWVLLWKRYWVCGCLGSKHKMQGKMSKWVLILEKCTLTVSLFPGRRSYKCPYCERVFIRANSELQKHIWIHEGVKPFKCSLCSYACRSKNNLQAHMLRHSSHKVGAGVSLCVYRTYLLAILLQCSVFRFGPRQVQLC